jgi:hypothetical protein
VSYAGLVMALAERPGLSELAAVVVEVDDRALRGLGDGSCH